MEGSRLALLVLMVWASGVCAQITPRGLGETLTVQCEYDKKFTDERKTWCKETTPIRCNPIVTTQHTTATVTSATSASGRTRIQDNKRTRVISVTVEKLTGEDTGEYWCGVDFPKTVAIVKRIKLKVSDGLPALVIQRVPGESVTLLCEYPERSENVGKTWCRETRPGTCLPIAATTRGAPATASSARTRIQDDKETHVISVVIEQLAEEDTGVYMCGLDLQQTVTPIKRIELQVSEGMLPEVIARAPGDTVTVRCDYPQRYEDYWKTWCRETIRDACNPILRTPTTSSNPAMASSGRITIMDDKQARVISVRIEKLTEEDAGVYWCGVEFTDAVKIEKRFKLQISNDARSTSTYTPTPANTQAPTHDTVTGPGQGVKEGFKDDHIIYISVGLGFLLLITFIALFYVLWIRRRRMKRLKDNSNANDLSPGPDVPPSRVKSEDQSSFSEMDHEEVKYATLAHRGEATYSNVGFTRRLEAPDAAANPENVEYATLNL